MQIDAPDIAEGWDQMNPEPSVEDYRAFSRVRIDALNHALEGIDPSLVRFHVCWGSWHGPHTTDIPFKDIVDLALLVNANGLTFEAANARHAHEWTIWRDIELPEGKYLIPGGGVALDERCGASGAGGSAYPPVRGHCGRRACRGVDGLWPGRPYLPVDCVGEAGGSCRGRSSRIEVIA